MTSRKPADTNAAKPADSNSKKSGVSYGIVTMAFVAGIIVGVVLTLYKTGNNPALQAVSREGRTGQVEQTGQKSPPAAHSEEIAALELKTARNPQDGGAWIQLGNLCFDSDLPEKAIAAYEKALAIDPGNADVWTDLGVMYRKTGKYEKAVECFDRAIAADPKHEIARFNKGIVLMHNLNDPKGAIKAWEELLAVNPLAMAPNGQSIDEMLKKMKQMNFQ